jgi:hypothetical protein
MTRSAVAWLISAAATAAMALVVIHYALKARRRQMASPEPAYAAPWPAAADGTPPPSQDPLVVLSDTEVFARFADIIADQELQDLAEKTEGEQ